MLELLLVILKLLRCSFGGILSDPETSYTVSSPGVFEEASVNLVVVGRHVTALIRPIKNLTNANYLVNVQTSVHLST